MSLFSTERRSLNSQSRSPSPIKMRTWLRCCCQIVISFGRAKQLCIQYGERAVQRAAATRPRSPQPIIAKTWDMPLVSVERVERNRRTVARMNAEPSMLRRLFRSPFFKMHIRLSKRLKKGIRRRGVFQSVHSLCWGWGIRYSLSIDEVHNCCAETRPTEKRWHLSLSPPLVPLYIVCIAAPNARHSARTAVALINDGRNMNGSELIF